MGTKKKENASGGLGLVALQLLGAILVLISCLAIFFLVGAWLYFEWVIKKYRGVTGHDDFKLSPEDQATLRDFSLARSRIDARIHEINELRRTLPLRSDGSFDSRNKEGKALNGELQVLREDLEKCHRTVEELSDLQDRDFKKWATIKSGLLSSRISIMALPVISLIFLVWTPVPIVELASFIKSQTGLPSIGNIDAFYGILAGTAGVATVIFLLLWAIGRALTLRS